MMTTPHSVTSILLEDGPNQPLNSTRGTL